MVYLGRHRRVGFELRLGIARGLNLSVAMGAWPCSQFNAAWWTSSLAKTFSASMCNSIEPLSSSTRAKSIGVAQGGLGEGGAGGDGGGGDGGGGEGEGGLGGGGEGDEFLQ